MIKAEFAGLYCLSPNLSTPVEHPDEPAAYAPSRCGLRTYVGCLLHSAKALLYTLSRSLEAASSLRVLGEANFSAERASAQTPTWIPGPDGDEGGPRDPQAAPGQGAEATLRLTFPEGRP